MDKDIFSFSLSTLRGRLTLWYVLSTVVIFSLIAGLFSGLLWYALHNQIDHHIHIVTGQAKQIVEDFEGDERQKLLTNLVNFEGMAIVMVADNGTELLQATSQDVTQLEKSKIEQLVSAGETQGHHPLHFTINDMRFGIADVTVENQPALLAVGYSVNILRQTFYQLMAITLGVMFVTLLPFTFIGHQLLKKYLHPLEKIAQVTQQVTQPQQLSTRITGLVLTDELKVIVNSFNNMFSQLERIFKTEHDFFSQAAHTLKSPLAVLRAKIEGQTKESQTNKQIMLNIIDGAVDTIQDLLLISRIETEDDNSDRKINLSKIVDELVELAQSLAQEKQIKITSSIQKNIKLAANERLLKRALGNIVHNALEYVEPNGSVVLLLDQKKDKIIFSATNSGTGLPAKEIPLVFNRFYRGANARQNIHGSGLGLAISKAAIEKFKGKIKFSSQRNLTKVEVVFEGGS